MSIIKTTAILIKARKYKEKDKILTFYSEDMGKIIARCKGARDPLNHWGHNTEPPNICWLALYEKNGFYLVTEMKPIFNLFEITRCFERLLAFEAFVQIIDHFQEGTAFSRSFFELCVLFLTRLNQSMEDPIYLSYAFLFDFLKWQGLPIVPFHCVYCENPYQVQVGNYSISYDEGGIVCPKCARERSLFNPISHEIILFLQALLKNNSVEEEKRMKVFFQNWEDLDRIVKDYYKCRFNKKLQTYMSLKKM
jgi:DNA repair protein RecO (recombination protein O)